MDFIKKNIKIAIITISASFLRIVNLGYSDFQGDEIKALFLPAPQQSISEFLLTQRKGPVQFVITYALKFFDPEYADQLLLRLPFAVAGILAVYFFYKFLTKLLNEKIAFYASFFFATSGFFISFSRIIQYQTYVILFMILALYCFLLAVKESAWSVRGMYLGFIFWALSMLSHYDGVFIFPIVAYLLIAWYKKHLVRFSFDKLKHPLIAGAIFLSLLLAFYIPFVQSIDSGTKSYWQGRLVGTGGKVSSSIYLFRVYQPIYVIHIYTILFGFGAVRLFISIFSLKSLSELFLIKFKLRKVKAWVFLLLTDDFQKAAGLTMWGFIPFVFLEGFVNIPGTHIYTYLLPIFVFLGIGVLFLEETFRKVVSIFVRQRSLRKLVDPAFYFGVFGVFLFVFLQSYAVFVDHNPEYPWESKKFLLWEFHRPSPVFHLSMFGFPYYRNWDAIGDYVANERAVLACPQGVDGETIENCIIETDRKIRYYSTNERKSIARYHITFAKDTDSAGYYVHITNPQSFTNEILSDKANYWASNYPPVKTFDSVNIYYMPQGTLEEIREKGY